jgi:hypothetical protein
MPVHGRLMLAVLLLAAAAFWGAAVLAHDVRVDGARGGSTLFTARGMHGADVGGDGAITRQLADACVTEGKVAVRWAAAPAVLGLFALGYGTVQLGGTVRESRRRWDERYRAVAEH